MYKYEMILTRTVGAAEQTGCGTDGQRDGRTDGWSETNIPPTPTSSLRMGYNHSWCCITVYPKKYAHGFCFAVLCCGYTLTDFPISIRLTSLALWQSNDCPSASKATLMNMDKYFMWIHYERLHNHNKAKHNKTVCIFLGIYCKRYPHKLMWSSTKIGPVSQTKFKGISLNQNVNCQRIFSKQYSIDMLKLIHNAKYILILVLHSMGWFFCSRRQWKYQFHRMSNEMYTPSGTNHSCLIICWTINMAEDFNLL